MGVTVSGEQIKVWKDSHGDIFKITLETGEVLYVRRPKIKEIEGAQYLLKEQKFISYNIFLLRQSYLGGSPIPEHEARLTAAADKMLQAIETVSSEMEKL